MNLTAIVKTTFCTLFLSLAFSVAVKAQSQDSTKLFLISTNNFIHFEAVKFGNSIELKWRASGKGSGQFTVERSKDGSIFTKIAMVDLSKATGTFNYVYTDRSPLKEKNYYRIKLAEKFSDVAMVDFIDNNIYTAYPTTTSTSLFIKIPKQTKIIVYNNQGEVAKTLELKESQNIDVSDLPNGHYQVHFEGIKESVRFIKL